MKFKHIVLSAAIAVFFVSFSAYYSSADQFTDWHGTATISDPLLSGVGYGDGKFVVAGLQGLYTSDDNGTTWTKTNNNLGFAVTFGNSKFVAVSSSVQVSADGLHWQHYDPFVPIGPTVVSAYPDNIIYANGLFVAGTLNGEILTSADAIHWSLRRAETSDVWKLAQIAYGNGVFVAVAMRPVNAPISQAAIIFTSKDGIAWTQSVNYDLFSGDGVTYGNGTFVITGGSNVLISQDGIKWTSYQAKGGVQGLGYTIYANDTFVATAFDGIWTSTDAVTWQKRYAISAAQGDSIMGFAFGNNTMLAITSGGSVIQASVSNSGMDNCAAVLSPTLQMRIPILTFNSQSYWLDFQYVQNTLDFTLTNAGVLADTSSFNGCAPATLSADFRLHVPKIPFGGASYWADFQYAHDLIFTLTGAGQN